MTVDAEQRASVNPQQLAEMLASGDIEMDALEIEKAIYGFMKFAEAIGFKRGVEAAAGVAEKVHARAMESDSDPHKWAAAKIRDRIRALLAKEQKR